MTEKINSPATKLYKIKSVTANFENSRLLLLTGIRYMFFKVLFLYSWSNKYPPSKVIINGYKKQAWFQISVFEYELKDRFPPYAPCITDRIFINSVIIIRTIHIDFLLIFSNSIKKYFINATWKLSVDMPFLS